MLPKILLPVILAGMLLSLHPAVSAPIRDRVRAHDREASAVVIDQKGVRTELTSFGRQFGPDFLVAYHGEAQVQIPFDKIRSFRVGPPRDRWAAVDILLVDGKRLMLQIEPEEYNSIFAGSASFGYYRISFGKIASCEFNWPTRDDGLGRQCPHGHLFYNSAWRFCPYDGKPLRPIVGDDDVGEGDGGGR
jgi:hypothetical protein